VEALGWEVGSRRGVRCSGMTGWGAQIKSFLADLWLASCISATPTPLPSSTVGNCPEFTVKAKLI
jgi:hypothetical protein